MAPRLDVVRHLGVYTAFHRSPGNKLAHGIFVPVIHFSMMCIQGYLRLPSPYPLSSLAHPGTVISLAVVAVLVTIDAVGSLVIAVWLLSMTALAGSIAARVPCQVLVPIGALVHLLAWYGTVIVGHGRIEPKVVVSGRLEDSNLYFRRRYYLARGLGRDVAWLDVLVQFSVAPLSVVQDCLALVGLRHELEEEIGRERADVLARLAHGAAPLSESLDAGHAG
jgi:uncharacterized membrane protein YGL010W